MARILSIILFALSCKFTLAAKDPYAPSFVKCPSNLKVRPASSGLSDQEQAWRSRRLPEVVKSLKSYLQNADIDGFNANDYLNQINSSNVPIAGLAISGGGATSGMGGLGVWQAFDDRYEPAVKAGSGGLVQCLSYLTGLSGGGIWAVLPLASNNLSSVAELRVDGDLTTNYQVGKTGNQSQLYEAVFESAGAKAKEGFKVAAADILGQLFKQFLPPSMHYGEVSELGDPSTAFYKGLAPMPLTLYSEVIPGQSPAIHKIMYPTPGNSTIYELSPFEFGSWIGGRVQAFLETKFLGTSMTKGHPANSSVCVNGFDKIPFAQGATGNAFNFWLTEAFYGVAGFWKRGSIPIPAGQKDNPNVQLIDELDKLFGNTFNESLWAHWPNPFTNYNTEMENVKDLLVVDGSEGGETIPLRPLIIPDRKVDFIIAYDASGEEPGNGFVNGTTFGKSATDAQNLDLPFPDVPDSATFVNLGLNRYPTFFGCNSSVETPLILYLPNSPWSAYSNYSFMKPEFTNKQLDIVFENSFNLVNYGNGTLASQDGNPPFSSCIACGLIARSLDRTGQSLPSTCQKCFQEHCWNGTTADTPTDPVYNPGLLVGGKRSFAEWRSEVWHK